MIRAVSFLLLLLHSSAFAQTSIDLVDQTYSTSLSGLVKQCTDHTAAECVWASRSVNATSDFRLDQSLQVSTQIAAAASADAFKVTTSTIAYFDLANDQVSASTGATANSTLSFRALCDGTTSLTLSFTGSTFSDGFVSLYDYTAGTSLFDYSWATFFRGDVPWALERATISLDKMLYDDHLYTLSMQTRTTANSDSHYSSIGVSGLVPIAAPVPEPSQAALALAGVIGVIALSHSRRYQRTA